jgi:hypothetical protein
MSRLTTEQALADVKAVRRDRGDSHWLECALALAKALDELSGEMDRLRAEMTDAKIAHIERMAENNGWAGQDASDHINTAPQPFTNGGFGTCTAPQALPPGIPPPPDGFVVAGWGGSRNQINDKMASLDPWRIANWCGADESRLYALPPDSPHFDKFRPVSEGPR